MEIDDGQIFYVSSADRISGTTSNFLYKFDIDTESRYDTISILAASIPKSYYLIASYNNEFVLSENGTNVNITIPSGNYTLTAWKNIIVSSLNTNSPHGFTYAVTLPSVTSTNTGKLTFTVSGNGDIQPIFIFSEHLYEQFGFDSGTYQFTANMLVSTNVVNLQLIGALFIHSDVCNNKHDSVLQEIYSNNSDYANITYQSTAVIPYSKKLAIKGINTYRFYLTDSYGNEIDLNGLNWNFTILFYKKNNTMNMIKQFIKLSLMQ